jgi:hypothetical protein
MSGLVGKILVPVKVLNCGPRIGIFDNGMAIWHAVALCQVWYGLLAAGGVTLISSDLRAAHLDPRILAELARSKWLNTVKAWKPQNGKIKCSQNI